jgi:hypothetical protein
LAKQQKPELKTYSIVNWEPVHNILQENDATVVIHRKTDGLVTSAVISNLKNKDVDVMFVHLDNVDHAGHKYGYSVDNKKYIESIEKTDIKEQVLPNTRKHLACLPQVPGVLKAETENVLKILKLERYQING